MQGTEQMLGIARNLVHFFYGKIFLPSQACILSRQRLERIPIHACLALPQKTYRIPLSLTQLNREHLKFFLFNYARKFHELQLLFFPQPCFLTFLPVCAVERLS